MSGALVIGYGNELRGDDAAGPRVAAAVEQWQIPDVRVLIRHQLTPELADPIASSGLVIFVDAALDAEGGVRVERMGGNPKSEIRNPKEIRSPKSEAEGRERGPGARKSGGGPAEGGSFAMTHATSPEGLLDLARELFGHCPTGWVVSIPARDFEFGETLSPLADQGVAEALRRIREILDLK